MAQRQQQVAGSADDALRFEPLGKRVRAELDGTTVLDTVRAAMVWEPRRLLGEYAVPEEDVTAELVASTDPAARAGPPPAAESPRLMPWVPFAAHTAPGTPLDVRAAGQQRTGAAFRPDDPDLAGLVLLDFAAFDRWWHEDEENVGHPRDPFHRIDALSSSRSVRVTVDGAVLARSTRPVVLFEANLPPRFYLPREDVTAELVPSATHTVCAYKGTASYWSVRAGDRELSDAVWGYEQPLHDAEPVGGLVCFDDSAVDVVVDAR